MAPSERTGERTGRRLSHPYHLRYYAKALAASDDHAGASRRFERAGDIMASQDMTLRAAKSYLAAAAHGLRADLPAAGERFEAALDYTALKLDRSDRRAEEMLSLIVGRYEKNGLEAQAERLVETLAIE